MRGSGSVPLTNGSGRPKNLGYGFYGSGTLARRGKTAYRWPSRSSEGRAVSCPCPPWSGRPGNPCRASAHAPAQSPGWKHLHQVKGNVRVSNISQAIGAEDIDCPSENKVRIRIRHHISGSGLWYQHLVLWLYVHFKINKKLLQAFLSEEWILKTFLIPSKLDFHN